MPQKFALITVVLLEFQASPALAENWPQWRGPNGDGISSETQLPVEWSASKNVAWKTPLPGEGFSSPIVWEGSVFITAAVKETEERLLLRLEATTGKILWQKAVLTAAVEPMHQENTPASSTPVTDGKHVYTSFQNGERVDLRCFDFDGNGVWAVQPLRFKGEHGYSCTPLLYKDLLFLDCSQNDESALIALEKNTGKLRWRFDRKDKEVSHVTPLLVGPDGAKQLITCGGDEVRGFDPESGKPRWWCQGPATVCVAGLAYGDGVVFAAGGYPNRTRLAIKASGLGEVSASHVLWRSTREVTYVPSPVYYQGYLYAVVDEGILHCLDAKSGQAVWSQRLEGRFRSSLIFAGKHLYATSKKGTTTVCRARPEKFQLVAENHLKETVYATAAVSNGRIYLRTDRHLYCIAGR